MSTATCNQAGPVPTEVLGSSGSGNEYVTSICPDSRLLMFKKFLNPNHSACRYSRPRARQPATDQEKLWAAEAFRNPFCAATSEPTYVGWLSLRASYSR